LTFKVRVNHNLPYARYNTATGTGKNPGLLTNGTVSTINSSAEKSTFSVEILTFQRNRNIIEININVNEGILILDNLRR